MIKMPATEKISFTEMLPSGMLFVNFHNCLHDVFLNVYADQLSVAINHKLLTE